MRKTIRVGVALLLAACASARGGGEAAASRVPEPGTYRYLGRYLPPGQSNPRTFTGTLVIARATAERLDGRWAVTGFGPEAQLGGFMDGAYTLGAEVDRPGERGTFHHRIRRGADAARLECTAEFLERVDGTGLAHPATCTLERVGPAPGEASSRRQARSRHA